MVKVVVVGAGVAGVSAALAAGKMGADVALLESSAKAGVSKALLPSLLAGERTEDEVTVPEVASLADEGVELRTGTMVTRVDHEKKRIYLNSSGSTIPFERVVICTGSSSELPRIRGISKPNVYVLKALGDYLRLSSDLDGLKKFVISGPVPLALKVGEILSGRGKRVQIYCGKDGLASQFSKPVASAIRLHSSRRGEGEPAELVDASLDSILGVDRAEAVSSEGNVLTCDAVVIIPRSLPFVPDVECERGRNGGILVDASMLTSLDGIFAAGDSAEFRFKSGSVPARLYSASRIGGEVAGSNAAGGAVTAAPSWSLEQVYFGVESCSAGLRQEEARSLGLKAATGIAEAREMSSGQTKSTFVSLVYDSENLQVYGLQVAGWQALRLSSAVSLIVSLGVTVSQLLYIESPYLPDSGFEVSPIALTARKILESKRS